MWGFPNNIIALKNVTMIQSSESLNFAIQHFPTDSIFYSFHVDGFNGYSLV